MSNFDEKTIERIKRLEREVERLRVKEGRVTDHGALSGLADNDHPQYLLTTGTAADSDKLDNLDSTAFALSGHDHSGVYLPIAGKAADSAKVANTTPTTAGLGLLSAADVPAQKQALGIKFTPMAQLDDDDAVSITPPVSQGFFLIRKAGGSNGGALVAFDALDTPYTVLIAGTAIMAATTGALTGTTGTDGKITVSAHSDGKIYVENRLGATIYLSYQVL